MKRIPSDFLSAGTRCGGELYLPDVEKPPVVVMGHGFAAERCFRLPAFAEKFTEKGLAVYLFDYRNFGESDGEPRNLVSPLRHVADWGAAINHVGGLGEVDSNRMALWGSSYGGGHVLVAAAKHPQVSAVVSQVPFVDGIAYILHHDFKYFLQGTYHGVRDILNFVISKPPHKVPVVGDPERFACMNTPEAKPGYLAMVPDDSDWKNEVPARAGITMAMYWPTIYASRIKCPVLVITGQKDTVVPCSAALKAARKIKNVEVETLPVGHFDVYVGEWFERAVEIECEFLEKHLRAG